VSDACGHSILKRASDNGLIKINCINIRDFAANKHKQTDDSPYGGSSGMVMTPQPVYDAFLSVKKRARCIYLTPQGRVFDQTIAQELSCETDLILLCGHYEGVDQRVLDCIVTDEISIGDYVLSGGEPAAIVLIDAVSRLISGVLGKEDSSKNESFNLKAGDGSGVLLEYPHYTRPQNFLGREVPSVLLSGNHKEIDKWRREQALQRTIQKRPDLLTKRRTEMKISDLQPNNVFKNFADICRIPHGSGNERELSDFIAGFAKKHSHDVYQDKLGNLIVNINASSGYENHNPIILQAHLDMVCIKSTESPHNFFTDPLKLHIENGFVTADGTTLGADNGIAVAMIMALMEIDTPHPHIEALLTIDEEAGMTGIEGVDVSRLKSRRMINMDSEEDDHLFAGCAGGLRVNVEIPFEKSASPKKYVFKKIKVGGLTGGHSGLEIHTQRVNAIQILAHALCMLNGEINFRLASISGGLKVNAIPREAEAIICVRPEDTINTINFFAGIEQKLKHEFRSADKNVFISMEDSEFQPEVIKPSSAKKILYALTLLPYGALAYSADFPSIVETSSNIGIVSVNEKVAVIENLLRGSVFSRVDAVRDKILALGNLLNAKIVYGGRYPAWVFDPDSALRKTAIEVYKNLFVHEPEVKIVHAGLECGHISEMIPGIDMLSFGPNMKSVHTTEEKVEIESVQKIWKFLLALLERL